MVAFCLQVLHEGVLYGLGSSKSSFQFAF
jgi:hypothetical protein